MDFNKMPKLLADAWHLNNNKSWFFFGFSSGAAQSAYLMNPQTTKGLFQELEKRIKKYEDENGEINMQGFKTGIQSPFLT